MYSQNGEKGSSCYSAELQFNQMSAKREATQALKSASDKDFKRNKNKTTPKSDRYDNLSICPDDPISTV